MPYKDPAKRRKAACTRTARYRERHPERTVAQNRKSQKTSRFARAVALAKQRGYGWTILREDYDSFLQQPCYYHGGFLSETGIGLDRLDNARGYHLDNIVACCGYCNFVRGNRFTPEEMKRLGKVVGEILSERGIERPRAALERLRLVGGTDVR